MSLLAILELSMDTYLEESNKVVLSRRTFLSILESHGEQLVLSDFASIE